jgi:hypothetical protein
MQVIRLLRAAAPVLLWFGFAAVVRAQTDEIQVYDAAIAAPGVFNLTWHNNYTFSGSDSPSFPGAVVPNKSLNGVTEWAYGVAPWFEAGLYFPLYSITRDGAVLYNGFKLRSLFVSPDAANRDVFYGVNFEFSFNTEHWNERRYTSEIRPIIGTHVGRFDFIFNPIVDNSYQGGVLGLEFVPATRVAMKVSENAKVALEEYDDFGPLSHFLPQAKQSHQLFPVLDVHTAWLDLEGGLGFGLTRGSDHRVFKLILSKDL